MILRLSRRSKTRVRTPCPRRLHEAHKDGQTEAAKDDRDKKVSGIFLTCSRTTKSSGKRQKKQPINCLQVPYSVLMSSFGNLYSATTPSNNGQP